MKKRIVSLLILSALVASYIFNCSFAPALYGKTDADVIGYESRDLKGADLDLPEKYSSYDLKPAILSGPQDQLSTSICWAFVHNELIQANIAKKTGVLYDFSEQAMKFETSFVTNPEWGYMRAPNEGGNEFMSTAYLARSGSVLEKDEPFSESEIRQVDPDKLSRVGYLKSVPMLEFGTYDPDFPGLDDQEVQTMIKNKADAITKIKTMIMDYGAVGASMYYESTLTYEDKARTNYCYTGIMSTPNHSVTIVGWDDTYSAENFQKTPDGDGAFIVKNTWGKHHNGDRTCYFYVSYYDKLITSQIFASEYEIENDIYDNVYQYDGYGWTQNGFVRDSSVLCVSKFYANKMTEAVSAVSTYVPSDDTTVEILVNVSGAIDDPLAYKSVSRVHYSEAGYYLVDFEPLKLEQSAYYVAVRHTTGDSLTYFALQDNVSGLIQNAENTPGTCFVGTDFSDLTAIEKVAAYRNSDAMHCIKAYTQSFEDTTPPSGKVFSDVEPNKWYSDEIEYCVAHGIFSGITDTTFEPQTSMTRAMFVKVLANLSGEAIWALDTPFTDVENSRWYTDAVAWAYTNGIVSGITDTTFAPNDNVTREQMCFMLTKYADYMGIKLRELNAQKTFTDAASIRKYAREAVTLCQMGGIISGMTDGSFAPQKSATRAEVAVLLTGLCKNYIY